MYTERYHTAFAALGFPLKPEDGYSESELRVDVLDEIHLPAALHDYYLVAGREQRLGNMFHQLLPPERWFFNAERLVFIDHRDRHGLYAGAVLDGDNPLIEVGIYVGAPTFTWACEGMTCAEFLIDNLKSNARRLSSGQSHQAGRRKS